MDNMTWKQIPSFINYEICKETQQVRRISDKKIISQRLDRKNGYLRLNLFYTKDKYKTVRTHRVMAETFIPKIEGRLEINHRDGNKLNNHISNLEWCNRSENVQHAYDHGLKYQIYKPENYPNNRIEIILEKSGQNIECTSLTRASKEIGCSRFYLTKQLKNNNGICEINGYKIKQKIKK